MDVGEPGPVHLCCGAYPEHRYHCPARMRVCAWCETVHPEHVSIEWTHGERLYFCTDTCLQEFGETG